MSLEKDETTLGSRAPEGVSTLSVLINVQHTTIERGYVSVVVTSDLVMEDGHLDMDGISAKALELGQSPAVRWYVEERQVQIHPLQRPPEPGEEVHRPWEDHVR
jgi:hypothetical protein